MSPNLQQPAVFRHATIPTNIKMVPDVTKTPCLMVTTQIFNTIVLITSCSRAMQHKKFHRVGRHHIFAGFNSGEECTL